MKWIDLCLALCIVGLAVAFVIQRFRPRPKKVVHDVQVRGALAKGLARAQKKREASAGGHTTEK